ncbi:MAG: hypothetical protein ACI4ED_02370 [Suilimivivens sp.]
MADKDNLQINGYRFGSKQDVETAAEELRKIEYFKEKTKGKTPRTLLALYDKLLDEKVFKTPVGFEYLRELQEQIKEANIPKEQIRPIPIYTNFSYKTGEELDNAFTRQRIRPAKKKININALQISICINILLAVLVIAMFAITLQSDNPNILNYKQAVINEYAAWEQELSERENVVREKEQELNIESAISDGRGE